MLKNLSIHNYALIQELELAPAEHLSVITGETGAGKSILLGAIGLLMGNRADVKSLWDSNSKCVIEGVFDISSYELQSFFDDNDLDYSQEIIIRREIGISGKSRAFINDTPVLLEQLKDVSKVLVDIHSQNDTLSLGSESYQLSLLDQFSESINDRSTFQQAYDAYSEAITGLDKLQKLDAELRKDADYTNFLLQEFEQAQLEEGQQEILEDELRELENSEEIKRQLHEVMQAISTDEYASLASIKVALASLQKLTNFGSKYQTLQERLESVSIELLDISSEIDLLEQSILHEPEKIASVQEKLSKIYSLQQKHQVQTVSELIQIHRALQAKVEKQVDMENELSTAKKEVETKRSQAMQLAEKLSKSRLKSMPVFASSIQSLLVALGIPNAVIEIGHQVEELNENGIDSISILFSANKGVSPQTLKQVASGGEFSRLMFSIKYLLADKMSMPTIIFDEIDSGISGEIALQLGALMKKMATRHQVISISHLPQMAAKADRHFYVYKDHDRQKSVSLIRELDENEHIEEVAKMISGDQITESARNSARELIAK